MSLRTRAAIAAFKALSAPTASSFRTALTRPAAAQQQLLVELCDGLKRTDRGRELGVTGPGDFFDKVPIVGWEELQPWADRQRAEEGRVLVADPVVVYEKTSGSTGASKYIPYTRALQWSFTRMFLIWVRDMAMNGPKWRTARMYFSISPNLDTPETTSKGVSVGLEDDSEYLQGWVGTMFRPYLVMPKVGHLRDPNEWRRALARELAGQRDLEVISVWNPSFLTVLLDTMDELGVKPVWPELKLISCWDEGHAAPVAEQLRQRFPDVVIQGKGLLATEAPLTVPLLGIGPVPLLDEVYFELLDDDGRSHALHEAADGAEYSLVISQKAGLLRYRIGDRVRVSGWCGPTPCLSFAGRGSQVCDLVGEKLNARFVGAAVDKVLPGAAIRTLIPIREPAGYVLLVDEGGEDLAAALERELLAAHHYKVARLLEQLQPVRVCHRSDAAEQLLAFHERLGMARGNVKPSVLLTRPADDELRRVLSTPLP